MASFFHILFDLFSDLTLSGIAYFALAEALNQAIGLIIESLGPDRTSPQLAAFHLQYELIVFPIAFIAFMAWSTRFFYRCRGHSGCVGKSLASILRWLSPLHPEPLKTCPCCWMRDHGKPTTGMDSLLQHQSKFRRPYPIERMSYAPSPAPTPHGEERCLTFDCVSPVSADETTNEWRDVGNVSDEERIEESLSQAVSPVADESTSGWRDLASSSDRERMGDTAVQIN